MDLDSTRPRGQSLRNPAWSNNYEAAVQDDPDGDGYATWQEYWCGTDPMNSNSFLRIDNVAIAGTNIVLEWQHANVGTGIAPISIFGRPDLLTGTWSYIGQKAPANGSNSWSAVSPDQAMFYKLAVTNMP